MRRPHGQGSKQATIINEPPPARKQPWKRSKATWSQYHYEVGVGVIEVIMLQRVKVGKYSHYQTTPVQREREERGKEGTEESLDGAVVFFVFFMMIV